MKKSMIALAVTMLLSSLAMACPYKNLVPSGNRYNNAGNFYAQQLNNSQPNQQNTQVSNAVSLGQ